MSEADAPDDEAAEGGKKQFASKFVSGIASSGGKVVSGGSSVVSGIASSGGKVVSSGGKAFQKISSPIGNAVRKISNKEDSSSAPEDETVLEEKVVVDVTAVNEANANEKTSDANEAETTSSKKDQLAKGTDASSREETAPAPKDDTAPEPQCRTTKAIASSIENQPDTNDSNHGGLLGGVENVTNKLLVSPLKGAAHLVAEGGNKVLVTPVKGASKHVAEGGKALFHTNSKGTSKDVDKEEDEVLPDVPPDATLQKMNVIINKRLKDVSIPDYYAIAWSEGDGTNNAPLYGPWLKESGKQEINVGEWQFADDETEFLGNWDEEKYSQKRIVTFVFNKQIPFQIGPTLAKVKHTQYCRVEGKDKCVVAMTIEMKGVPYSDCFNVEIRWVATRSGKNDIAIQVGLFVNFVQKTLMASKIRSGTTDQTTQQQVQLFRTIKKACGAVSEEVVEEPMEGEGDTGRQYKCTWLSNVFPFMHQDALANRSDEVAVSAKSADKKMKEVMTVLADTDPSEANPVILDQLVVVNDALDKILAT